MSAQLPEMHKQLRAQFTSVNGVPVVNDYGNAPLEYDWLRQSVGIIDLSCRGRICVAGNDRNRFLHGQVTNDVNKLKVGQGTYAAIASAKGKMVGDANIYRLEDELLLDFEPGATTTLSARLEKYVIADDVQVLDVSDHYGMLAVIGPKAIEVLMRSQPDSQLPAAELEFTKTGDAKDGEIYCMRHSHGAAMGFDLFVPVGDMARSFGRLVEVSKEADGGPIGWQAIETLRIEAGIPRFRQDMDETNLVPETGIESRAVSYSKGCYTGQEVIARIRTYGQVAKSLRGLKFDAAGPFPCPRDLLLFGDKEVGYVTSTVASPSFGAIGLGYVRREHNEVGTELTVKTEAGPVSARIVELPFR